MILSRLDVSDRTQATVAALQRGIVRLPVWYAALAMWTVVAGLAFQPETAMLRRLYEENLARREREFGAADARTARRRAILACF